MPNFSFCTQQLMLDAEQMLQVKAHSIIVATRATAKRLGIPSEEKFWSQGISACAISDGEQT